MNHAIDRSESVQGVIGAFIYNAKGLALIKKIPTSLKQEKLLGIGKVIAKICSEGRAVFSDIADVFLSFEKYIVIVREITDKSYLIVVFERPLNFKIIAKTMGIIKDEID